MSVFFCNIGTHGHRVPCTGKAMAGETNEADEAMVVLSAGQGPVRTALVDLPEQDQTAGTARQPERCVLCMYICM